MKKWTVHPPSPLSVAARFLQEVSAVCAYRTIHLSPNGSISRTQCGFKRTGALKSAAGSSFSHDVREGERWVVLRNWVHAILLRHLQLSRQRRWTAYPRPCKWCRTQAHFDPTPLGSIALSASLRYGFVGKRAQYRISRSTYQRTKLGSALSSPLTEVGPPFFAQVDWSFTHSSRNL